MAFRPFSLDGSIVSCIGFGGFGGDRFGEDFDGGLYGYVAASGNLPLGGWLQSFGDQLQGLFGCQLGVHKLDQARDAICGACGVVESDPACRSNDSCRVSSFRGDPALDRSKG